MDEKYLGYLDLKEDISFKRYFSINKQVLFSLIKSFLPIPDNAPDMMILNPGIFNPASETANQQNQSGDKLHLQDSSIPPDTPGGKQVVLDLHVKLHSGENIDIEMQGYSQKDFFSRMLAYWVQLHSYGMKRGQKFSQINPSYLLVFTRFTVFDEEDYINETTITLRKHRHKELTKDFGLVIVELNKFNKSHLELVDMTDRWCYHQALGGIDSRASKAFITRWRDEDGIKTFRGNIKRGYRCLERYIHRETRVGTALEKARDHGRSHGRSQSKSSPKNCSEHVAKRPEGFVDFRSHGFIC